jgi:hypothetical protein
MICKKCGNELPEELIMPRYTRLCNTCEFVINTILDAEKHLNTICQYKVKIDIDSLKIKRSKNSQV